MQGLRLAGALLVVAPACGDDPSKEPPPPADELQVDKVVLGKLLFFDTNLSKPAGQSCASCHDPETGFADPHSDLPVSRGA
ncbi:MAG TPA: cytochrome-c peroxidase, partial [Archangium sp.]|nr:cytochrome-c peroxidase [Archangium sp.]